MARLGGRRPRPRQWAWEHALSGRLARRPMPCCSRCLPARLPTPQVESGRGELTPADLVAMASSASRAPGASSKSPRGSAKRSSSRGKSADSGRNSADQLASELGRHWMVDVSQVRRGGGGGGQGCWEGRRARSAVRSSSSRQGGERLAAVVDTDGWGPRRAPRGHHHRPGSAAPAPLPSPTHPQIKFVQDKGGQPTKLGSGAQGTVYKVSAAGGQPAAAAGGSWRLRHLGSRACILHCMLCVSNAA